MEYLYSKKLLLLKKYFKKEGNKYLSVQAMALQSIWIKMSGKICFPDILLLWHFATPNIIFCIICHTKLLKKRIFFVCVMMVVFDRVVVEGRLTMVDYFTARTEGCAATPEWL